MFNVLEVLANGLSTARTRVNVIASNIANAETTRTPEGGPFKRRDVVQVGKTDKSAFASALDRASLAKPSVEAVVEDQEPPRLVYQPGHPDANKDGFVAYPNINVVTSMTDMMTATRLYQANITAVQTAREMADAAKTISGTA